MKFLLITLLFLFTGSPVKAVLDLPSPSGYVNDYADIFSSSYEEGLEAKLDQYEKKTTNEISVVTIESLQETTIEDYAVKLFEQWKIGKADQDNGLLLLIAPNERELRIEVGYGLEPIITDSRAGRIIRDQITPEFKEENYEEGVEAGINQIITYLNSGQPPLEEEIQERVENIEDSFGFIVFAFMVITYLASFWGRSKKIWPGGLFGGILGGIGGLILGTVGWFIFLSFSFGLYGLFLDWLLSKNWKKLKKSGKSTNWWRTFGGFSSGGGRSSSGGGFSGFSGGSSGGGGASGSW